MSFMFLLSKFPCLPILQIPLILSKLPSPSMRLRLAILVAFFFAIIPTHATTLWPELKAYDFCRAYYSRTAASRSSRRTGSTAPREPRRRKACTSSRASGSCSSIPRAWSWRSTPSCALTPTSIAATSTRSATTTRSSAPTTASSASSRSISSTATILSHALARARVARQRHPRRRNPPRRAALADEALSSSPTQLLRYLSRCSAKRWRSSDKTCGETAPSRPAKAGFGKVARNPSQSEDTFNLTMRNRITAGENMIKSGNFLLQLRTDSADQPVAMRRHRTQDQHRAQLQLSIRLLDTGQSDGPLLHGRRSASVYSGSLVP